MPPAAEHDMMLAPGEVATLLERTSRTFALTIPILDEPIATDVGLAYLLLRIADTLEDAPLWGRDARVAALDSFGAWMMGEDDHARTWLEAIATSKPTEDEACLTLLRRADALREALVAREPPDLATTMTLDIVRTSSKMADFVRRQTDEGGLVLGDMADLQAYCYAVAGIVGELLTEVFLARRPALERERGALMKLAPAFGEALQLVNILKDAASDAREGRVYLPRTASREDVVRLARADLERANEYIAVLARGGASSQICAFCALPVRLAEATLNRLEAGAAKLTRDEVMTIFSDVTRATHLQ